MKSLMQVCQPLILTRDEKHRHTASPVGEGFAAGQERGSDYSLQTGVYPVILSEGVLIDEHNALRRVRHKLSNFGQADMSGISPTLGLDPCVRVCEYVVIDIHVEVLEVVGPLRTRKGILATKNLLGINPKQSRIQLESGAIPCRPYVLVCEHRKNMDVIEMIAQRLDDRSLPEVQCVTEMFQVHGVLLQATQLGAVSLCELMTKSYGKSTRAIDVITLKSPMRCRRDTPAEPGCL